MEKLKFTNLKTSNSKIHDLQTLLTASAIGTSFCMCLFDLFNIDYSVGSALRGNFAGGLIKTWNQMADAVGNSDFVILPKFAGESNYNGLYLSLIILTVIAAAFFIIKGKKKPVLLIFVLPLVTMSIIFELNIGSPGAIFFIISIMLAAMYMKTGGKGFLQEMILTVVIGALVFSLFSAQTTSFLNTTPTGIKEAVESADSELSNLYFGENPLKSGDLTQRERAGSDETALTVKMSAPQSIYLRGFIGDLYMGDRWESHSNASYYNARNLIHWLGKGGFNPEGQIGQAKELTAEGAEENDTSKNNTINNTIYIETDKADKRFIYIPYEIKEYGDIENAESKGGNYLVSGKFSRNGSYTYISAENSTKDWTETAARIFTEAEYNSHTSLLTEYFLNESYYNEYVYENFTYISKSDNELLHEYLGEMTDQRYGHEDYKIAIAAVKDFLKDKFIYSEKLGAPNDENANMLDEFLKTGKGYDVQYASAAVLMFRYFGIPSRYAEGYLVTPEDVKEAEAGEEIEISRERAHAWVEIYIDGAGFVPVEVSPPYYGIMEEADMDIGISNIAAISSINENRGDSHSGNHEPDMKEDRDESRWILILIISVILLIIMFLILYILKKAVRVFSKYVKRMRLFKSQDINVAVSAMYGYMEENSYPLDEHIIALGNKAAYSLEEITEKNRAHMLEYIKQNRKDAKNADKKKR